MYFNISMYTEVGLEHEYLEFVFMWVLALIFQTFYHEYDMKSIF